MYFRFLTSFFLENAFNSRTTTLEDIYRHYTVDASENSSNKTGDGIRKNLDIDRRQDYQVGNEYRDDYDEGDITGYMTMQQPTNLNNNVSSYASAAKYATKYYKNILSHVKV